MTDIQIQGTNWQEDPISEGEKAQKRLLKNTAPVIVAAAAFSGVLSGVGFINMQEQLTLFEFWIGTAFGGAVALIVSTVWNGYLGMAGFAQTMSGKIVQAGTMVLMLVATLAISTTTNLVSLLDNPSRALERQHLSQSGTLLVEQATAIGSQLDAIHRTLEQNQDYFLDLQLREVAGTNSRGGDVGPISNHYGQAAALFTPGLESVERARRQFNNLSAEADALVDRLIETTRDGSTSQETYATVVQDLRSTVRQIAVLEPEEIARSSAMHISTNVQTPVDLRAYGRPLVQATQSRLPEIAAELIALADNFEPVVLPELSISTPVDRVFAAAPRYPQLVAMAVGLDMLPFLIFLIRLPAMLAIQAEIRRKKEEKIQQAKDGAPDGSMTVRDIERALLSMFAGARTIETLMENHDPMDQRVYDLLGPRLSKFLPKKAGQERVAGDEDDHKSEQEAG